MISRKTHKAKLVEAFTGTGPFGAPKKSGALGWSLVSLVVNPALSSTPVLSTDEDIESVPSCNPIVCKIQAIAYGIIGICMEERGIQYIKVRRSKSKNIERHCASYMAELVTLTEENFDIKKS